MTDVVAFGLLVAGLVVVINHLNNLNNAKNEKESKDKVEI